MLGPLVPVKGTVHVDVEPPREASQYIGYVSQNVHSNHSFPITAIGVVLIGKFDPKKRRLSRRSTTNRREALKAYERMEMATYADAVARPQAKPPPSEAVPTNNFTNL
jgi:ABC-type Mn2+/Zn2+ transport system ATPase subunit